MQIVEEANYLADILPTCLGKAITGFVRDAIEEIEPGVHQYFPCEIFFQDGTQLDEDRWILNICNRLDTIAVEHSNIVESPNTSRYMTGNGPFDVKLWKDKVAGKAIWHEWRYSRTYAADALVERLREADIHGFEFYKYLPEV